MSVIRIYDGRWKRDGRRVIWKGPEEGNVRRMQVVTIQSRQFPKLPHDIQDRLFTPGNFTEMWPMGPDSVDGLGPRNIRIAYIEDQLLDLANDKRDQIELIPEPFDAESARPEIVTAARAGDLRGQPVAHLLALQGKFGAADFSLYGLDGEQLSDMVLGLRVKSLLPDPMAVLLDGGAEPVPAELAERRGVPQHAAHRPGGEGSGRDQPGQADVHRLHPVRALPAGAEARAANPSAAGTTPCSCPHCCAGRRSGRGWRKDSRCSASRRRT